MLITVLCFLPRDAFAIPTGTGSEQFPLGSDSGDEFNVGSGKFVVQGNTGNVGVGTFAPDATIELIKSGTTSPFMISNTATGNGNIFVISSSGNIGLGTISPAGALSVLSGNVGIGTVSPNALLAVGQASEFQVNASGAIAAVTGITTTGGYSQTGAGLNLLTGNVGLGTTTPVAGLAVMTGNVGIGTWSPIASLEVKGGNGARIWTGVGTNTNAASAGELYVEGDLEVDGTIYGDGTGITALASGFTGWTDGGTNVYTTTTTDSVGIGTTTPDAILSITSTAAQDLLRVNDAGVGDATPFVVDLNGNVGIGTSSPDAKLVVDGNDMRIKSGFGLRFNEATNNASSRILDIAGSGGSILSFESPTSTSRMVVNGGTGRVGIGTMYPGSSFAVSGGQTIGSGYTAAASPADGLLVQGNMGIGTTTPVGALTVMNGNVGIGTWSPIGKLQVMGPIYGQDADNYIDVFSNGNGVMNNSGNILLTFDSDNNQSDRALYITNNGTANRLLSVLESGNIGFGTFSPSATLEVLKAGSVSPIMVSTAGNSSGDLLTMTASGNIGLGTTIPVGALTVMNGNVGIGTWSPRVGLEIGNAGVLNNVSASNDVYIQGKLEVDGTLYGDGSGLINVSAGGWTDGGTNVYTSLTTDNVGIGTTTPTGTLEVVKTAAGTAPLMVSSVAAGDGDLLIVASSSNVGIGTASPGAVFEVANGSFAGMILRDQGAAADVGAITFMSGASTRAEIFATSTSLNLSFNNSSDRTLYLTQSGLDAKLSVGINDANPDANFEISRDNVGTQPLFMLSSDDATDGNLLIVSSSGNVGIGTTTPVAGLVVMNGNVGIGTWSPSSQFEVKGGNASIISTGGTNTNATGAGELYVQGDLEVDGTFYGDGSGLTGTSGLTVAGGWTDGGTNVFTSTTTDNVGIGTTTPSTTLEIVTMSSRAPLMISSLPTADGDLFVVRSDGNVGLGTVAPNARLDLMPAAGGNGIRLTELDTNANTVLLLSGGNSSGSLSIYADGAPNITFNGNSAGTFNILKYDVDLIVHGDTVDDLIHTDASADSVYLGNNAMTISALTKNVGIGTSTPVAGLAVMNGNVGIGTWSPTQALQVMGSVAFLNGNQVNDNGDNYIQFLGSGNAAIGARAGGLVVSSSYTGVLSPTNGAYIQGNVGIGTTTPTGGLTVMNGNVGIGTWSPSSQFEVKGGNASIISTGGTNTNATGAGELYVQGDLEVDGTIYGDGSGLTGTSGLTVAGGWTDGGTNVYTSITTDNVGIGTTTPSTTLEIVKQGASAPLMVSSTAAADGDYFIVAPTGNVGIGSAGAEARLTIVHAGGTDSGLLIKSTSAGSYATVDWKNDVGDLAQMNMTGSSFSNGFFTSRAAIFNSGSPGGLGISAWHASGVIRFGTGGTGAATERMRIASDGNVGIGTFAPGSMLSVSGGAAVGSSSAYTTLAAPVNGLIVEGNVGIGTTAAAAKLVIPSGNVGFGTLNPVAGLAVMNGSVGIGTWSPSSQFEVKGGNASVISTGGTNTNATGAGELYVQGDLEVDGTIYGDGSGITGGTVLNAGGWTDGGINVYTSITTDNVGIGTTTPTSTLEIVKTAAGTAPFMISATATADGDLLLVKSNGSVGIGTVNFGSNTGLAVMNGNVGIGTWNPRTTLDVNGFINTPYMKLWRNGGTGTAAEIFNDSAVTGMTDGIYFTTTTGVLQFLVGSQGFSLSPNAGLTTKFDYIYGGNHAYSEIGTTFDLYGGTGIKTSLGANNTKGYLTVDTTGNIGIGTDMTSALAKLAVLGGNVGIGTLLPGTALDVNGIIRSTSGGVTFPDGTTQTTAAGGASGWTDGGTNVFTSTTTDNVGIGTTTPTATLLIQNASAIDSFRVDDSVLDASPFIIDAAGNVGIGTTTPGYPLDVRGEIRTVGVFSIWSGGSLYAGGGTYGLTDSGGFNSLSIRDNPANLSVGVGTTLASNGLAIMNGNVGIGTWNTTGVSGALIVAPGIGNVGIGTIRPGAALDVNGIIRSTSGGVTFPDGTTQTTAAGGASGWTDGGANVYTSTTTDNVGIGTTTPNAATLEIVKNAAQAPLKISSLVTGNGDFMNVSSAGLVGIGTTLNSDSTGLAVMNGNVGIGTWSPTARLAVATGNVLVSSGNLGIGMTTAPSAQLDIRGSAATGGDFYLQHSNISGFTGNLAHIYALSVYSGASTHSGNEMYLQRIFSTAGGGSIALSGNTQKIESTITNFTGTNTVSGNELNIGRSISNFNPAVTTVSGAVVSITDAATLIGGTMTHTADTVDILQSYTSGSGTALNVSNAGAGLTMRFNDDGTYTDSTPFVVDAVGNIGIGTSDASAKLVVASGNVGIGTFMPVNGTAIMNGNVGLGTWSPRVQLEIGNGGTINNLSGLDDIYVKDDIEVDGSIFLADGTEINDATDLGGASSSGWTDGGINVYTSATTDNVGIGTTTPTATLLVENVSAIDSFRVNDALLDSSPFIIDAAGNIGIGTSDASAKLVVASGNVGIGTFMPVNGTAIMNGNVGIGTWSPEARFVAQGVGSKLTFDDVGTTTISGVAGSFGGLRATVNGGSTYFFNAYQNSLTLTHYSGSGGDYSLQSGATTTNFNIQTTVATTPIIFKPNSIEAMRITAAGNVGIGTSGPNAKFVVESGNVGIGTTLPVGGTSIMNGNVGIGTWSPQSAFHLKNPVGPAVMTIDSEAGNDVSLLRLISNPSGGTDLSFGQIGFYDSGSSDGNMGNIKLLRTDIGGGGSESNLTFETRSASGSISEKMRILHDGNVGIGTTAPVGGLVVMTGNVGLGTWSPRVQLEIGSGGAINNLSGLDDIYVKDDIEVDGSIFLADGTEINDATDLGGASSSGWTDGGTNVYTTATTDNVGIGTTTPSSTLEIVKTAAATAPFMISSTATSDGNLLLVQSDGNVGIGTTFTNGNALSVLNGNVGIGTYAPISGFALNVQGGGIYTGGNIRAPVGVVSGVVYADSSDSTKYINPDASADPGYTAGISAVLAGNVGLGTSTPVGALAVMNGNVGIGTWSPNYSLQVNGDIAIPSGNGYRFGTGGASAIYGTGNGSVGDQIIFLVRGVESARFDYNGNLGIGTSLSAAGLAVMNGNVGIGTWSLTGNSGAFIVAPGAGNVGIGTIRPGTSLDVNGIIRSTSGGFTFPDGTTQTTASAGAASGWTDGGTNVFTSMTTDTVGIGTTTPTAILLIENVSTSDTFRVNDSLVDATPFIIGLGGNVGIGTVTAGSLLSVSGGAAIGSNAAYTTLAAPADGLMVQGNVGIGTTAAAEKFVMPFGNMGIGTLNPVGGLVVMTGNVGIGTWSPTRQLDVIGYVQTSPGFGHLMGPAGSASVLGQGYNIGNDYIAFSTEFSERMRLDTAGNLGIGTSTPVAGLAVMNGNVGIGTWSPGSRLQVNNTVTYASEFDNGTRAINFTIDWNAGNKQRVTLGAAGLVVTFTAPTGGVANMMIKIVQDGSGSRTIASWPGSVRWPGGTAPTLTTTAGATDIVSCYYDRTNYFCTNSLDFQ